MTTDVEAVAPGNWPTLPESISIGEILDVISHHTKIERSALRPDARMDSLNIASLDMVEVLFEIEEKFDVYISLGDELTREIYLGGFIQALTHQIQVGASQPGGTD